VQHKLGCLCCLVKFLLAQAIQRLNVEPGLEGNLGCIICPHIRRIERVHAHGQSLEQGSELSDDPLALTAHAWRMCLLREEVDEPGRAW